MVENTAPVTSAGRGAETGQRRRRRVLVRWLFASTVAVLFFALVGLPVYAFPPVQEPGRADVAYVIGPPTEQRVALAEQLQRDGLVREVLISVPLRGGQSASELSACNRTRVTCVTPEVLTTKGEVATLTSFVEAHNADSVIVITYAPHVVRTRFVLDKCFDGDATVVAAPQPLGFVAWVYQYAYQTAAFVKAATTPCAEPPEKEERATRS